MAAEQPEPVDDELHLAGLKELRRTLRRGWRSDDARWQPDDIDSMVHFCEMECHARLVGTGVLEETFRSILAQVNMHRPVIRVALKGPRGGGKTYFAALLVAVLWRFYGFDTTALGGSFDQSKRFYAHFKRFVDGSPSLRRFAKHPPMATHAEALTGATVEIHTASQRSVRGPHPCGPSGGGALILDEVAQMEDAIVDAAMGQLGTASPSLCLQLSTMGEAEAGRFWEIIDDEEHKGYDLRSFDGFDVAAGCPYDCETTCPVPEHFAKDYSQPIGGGKTRLVHKAYCGGKAHKVAAWLHVDELAAYHRAVPRETFEREYMGRSGAKVGKYFDPQLLDRAAVNDVRCAKSDHDHRRRFLALEKTIGIDWGYGSKAVAVFVCRIRQLLVPYRWLEWDHTPYSDIRSIVRRLAWQEGVNVILPDSEDPSSNEELRNELTKDWYALPEAKRDETTIPSVHPVVFSKDKRYAYGELVRRLEKELMVIPKTFAGVPVDNVGRALKWMRALAKRPDGLPEKKNDHYPDALMCAVLHFSPERKGEPMIG